MPRLAATWMSTASLIALTPSRIWSISRWSGPRTAATMQNSVAPVAAVWRAASTNDGMSSQTERTGELNKPDCEQKWQSSGQPPVFSDTIPSTSTSGPHHRVRTSRASCKAAAIRSSGRHRTSRMPASSRPVPSPRTWFRARWRMSRLSVAMAVPYKFRWWNRHEEVRVGDWLSMLARKADLRSRAGLRRVARPRRAAVDLAGNDYLGLSRHPQVLAAAARALDEFGLGATGSRLVRGTTDEHLRLESSLASFMRTPSTLVYSSGYLANLGAVRALASLSPRTVLIADA